MLQNVARTLHPSMTSLYLLGIGLLLLLAIVIGSILARLLRSYGNKRQSSWGELTVFLSGLVAHATTHLAGAVCLPQSAPLPRRYERLGSELLSALMAVALYFFPTQAIVLFLRRMADLNEQT